MLSAPSRAAHGLAYWNSRIRRRKNAPMPALHGCASGDENVAELPWIGVVNVLGVEFAAPLNRCPVGVAAKQMPEIRTLNLKTAPVIHLVRLDDASSWIFQHPHNTGKHG